MITLRLEQVAMGTKQQMTAFTWELVFELKLAWGVLQVQKVLDTEQSRHS